MVPIQTKAREVYRNLVTTTDDILSGMSDLLGQVEQSSDSDLRDDGGLEKLVRETTAEGD